MDKKPLNEMTIEELDAVIDGANARADAAWKAHKKEIKPIIALRDQKQLTRDAEKAVKNMTSGQRAALKQILLAEHKGAETKVTGATRAS